MGFKGCSVTEGSHITGDISKKCFPPRSGNEIAISKYDKDERYFCWFDSTKYLIKVVTNPNGLKTAVKGTTKLDETVFGSEESVMYLFDYING